MSAMGYQITSLTIVYSTVYSGADQSTASLAFVGGIHLPPVNSLHKGPVPRKVFPSDEVIMRLRLASESKRILLVASQIEARSLIRWEIAIVSRKIQVCMKIQVCLS